MKLRKTHFLLVLAMLLFTGAGLHAQTYPLTVSGTVLEQGTGNPIPNHLVYIELDSMNGFPYYNTVTTNASGVFSDVIQVPNGLVGSGQAYTFDCNQQFLFFPFQYSPNLTTHNFAITMCGPSTACQAAFASNINGSQVSFTNQSQGSSLLYSWDFGDGNTSTLQNPTHNYAVNGSYLVCLTISNQAQTCQNTFCDTLTVTGGSGGCQAFFTYSSAPVSGYVFLDSSLASPGTVTAWNWDFGDGNSSTLQYPNHSYNTPGVYMVCLTITSSTGCTDTYCDSLVVGGGSSVCNADFGVTYLGNSIVFNDISTSSPGVITGWFWDFGDGNTSNNANPTHTYANPGLYSVCLTIFTSDSCSSTDCASVQAAGGGVACNADFGVTYQGNSIAFNDISTSSPGVITGWFWDFGDGNTSNNANPTHTYANPGLYSVCLTIFTSDSCSSTDCASVQAAGGGAVCAADYNWSYNGNSVVFMDLSTSSPGQVSSWSWDFGDGNYSNMANPTHTYNASGLFNVCLTIQTTDSCFSTTCYQIQANGGGSGCQASFYSYPDTTGQFSTILVNNSTGTGLSYAWDFGDGGTSTQAYPTHGYNAAGVYTVCLTVSTPICSSTYCDSVTITGPNFTMMVNSPFLSIDQNLQPSKLEMDVYPNPAHEAAKVRFDLPEAGETALELIDLQGKVIMVIERQYLNAGDQVVDLPLQGMPQGIYFLHLKSGNYQAVQKVLVQPLN